jgi:hypothetical protein
MMTLSMSCELHAGSSCRMIDMVGDNDGLKRDGTLFFLTSC